MTNNFCKELKDRILLSDIIRSTVKLIKKGRTYIGLCPFHHEKTPSFTVNDQRGFYHCFGCGSHGDIFAFVMFYHHLSFTEAVTFLSNHIGLLVPSYSKNQKTDNVIYETLQAGRDFFCEQLTEKARSYLTERGITQESIEKFELGFAHESGLIEALKKKRFSLNHLEQAGLVVIPEKGSPYERFRNRLMFPIHDLKGRVLGFGGRVLNAMEPKYINSPETEVFHKGRMLYGLYHRDHQYDKIMIVEGYLDVIACYQAGYPFAVAPLGTSLTEDQLHNAWKHHPAPLLCFDGDAAGLKAAKKAYERALPFIEAKKSLSFCFLPPGEDPDSLLRSHPQSFKEILASAIPLIDKLWLDLIENQRLKTPEEKSALLLEIKSVSSQIKDRSTAFLYEKDLKNRFYTLTNPVFKKTTQLSPFLTAKLKKKLSIEKILLATLINHPTLIPTVIEQIFLLDIQDPILKNLYEILTMTINSLDEINEEQIQKILIKKGFERDTLLPEEIYHVAPFVKATTPYSDVLEGWRLMWEYYEKRYLLRKEFRALSNITKQNFDEKSWKKLKQLKLMQF